MFHNKPLCESCQKNTASVFVSRIAFGKATKQRLCEACAYKQGAGKEWLQAFEKQIGSLSPEPVQENAEFVEEDTSEKDALEIAFTSDEFNAEDIAEVLADNLDLPPEEMDELLAEMESMLGEVLSSAQDDGENETPHPEMEFPAAGPLPPPGVLSARCSKCGTTWDRLREDGRAGCTQCYEEFADKLLEVMGRMQREPRHVGKAPRAAQRRRRRLEQLRTQRDHRLEMLQRRLQEAITAENYEDAAALRDKIKMVESTIVKDD